MTTILEPADVLEQAADIIEDGGLARWNLKNNDGAHCAIGALMEVEVNAGLRYRVDYGTHKGGSGRESLLLKRTVKALYDHLLEDGTPVHPNDKEYDVVPGSWTVARWSNTSDEAADVVDVMRRTAKELRNEAVPR